MSERNNDVIMYMTLDGSGQVAAEARSVLDSTDDMIVGSQFYSDFAAGKFFELRTFSFGVSLSDSKTEKGNGTGKPGQAAAPTANAIEDELSRWKKMPPSPMRDAMLKHLEKSNAKSGQFEDFLVNPAAPLGENTYPVQLSDISYERVMDKASPVIWNYFNQRKVVKEAVIVKRKNDGWSEGPQGFLAFYFKDLLITDIDWDEDEVVVEKVKMIARGAYVIYKVQRPDLDESDTVGKNFSYIQGLFS